MCICKSGNLGGEGEEVGQGTVRMDIALFVRTSLSYVL